MAIYRTVSMTFWTDSKVIDDFTPKDKLFYLYLFTNPHTNLCGCYEISVRQIMTETGYGKETIEGLIERFQTVHNVIRYSKNTKEILLLKWHKYNWTSSEKFKKPLLKEINEIKEKSFFDYLMEVFNGNKNAVYGIDTKCIDENYIDTNCSDTTVTVTDTVTVSDTDTVTNTDTDNDEVIKDIISYLNTRAGTHYQTSKQAKEKINGRLKEGFTPDDFRQVIDTKVDDWLNDPKMNQFLRPSTLFAVTHFEEYLNQGKSPPKDVFEEWANA